MALFLPDEAQDHVVIRYAAGVHAAALRGVTRPTAMGIAGWAAVNRRSVLNGEPGARPRLPRRRPRRRCAPASWCRSSRATRSSRCSRSTRRPPFGFTEDHLRLLEVLAPRLANALIDAAIADEDSQLFPADRGQVLEARAKQLTIDVVQLKTDTRAES